MLRRHYTGFFAPTSPCASPLASRPLGFMRPCRAGLSLSGHPGPSQLCRLSLPRVLHPLRRAVCGSFVHSYSHNVGLRPLAPGSAPIHLSRNTILSGGSISARQIFLDVAALWFARPPDRSQSPTIWRPARTFTPACPGLVACLLSGALLPDRTGQLSGWDSHPLVETLYWLHCKI